MKPNEASARAFTDLLEISRNGAQGYHEAAEGATNPRLKSELNRFSEQRARFAAELEQQARQLGVAATHETTVESVVADAAAAVHRGWINIKTAVTGHNDVAILDECETGDAVALQAYETALQANDLPLQAKAIIQKQHGQVLQAKNWITQQKRSGL
jgi:uncharacterized protein (TIGR02284 family)